METTKKPLQKQQEFRTALRDAGITKKGEKIAGVVWNLADQIFAADPEANTFEVLEVACWMLRMKASNIRIEEAREKTKPTPPPARAPKKPSRAG